MNSGLALSVLLDVDKKISTLILAYYLIWIGDDYKTLPTNIIENTRGDVDYPSLVFTVKIWVQLGHCLSIYLESYPLVPG